MPLVSFQMYTSSKFPPETSTPSNATFKVVFAAIEASFLPDGLVGVFLNHAGQSNESIGMKHGIATRKCDIHIGIDNTFEQLFYRYSFSSTLIPRLGVMASRTLVFAPSTVERGAKTNTIDGCAILDGKDTDIIGGRFCHG